RTWPTTRVRSPTSRTTRRSWRWRWQGCPAFPPEGQGREKCRDLPSLPVDLCQPGRYVDGAWSDPDPVHPDEEGKRAKSRRSAAVDVREDGGDPPLRGDDGSRLPRRQATAEDPEGPRLRHRLGA